MGNGQFTAGGNPSIIHGGVEIILFASCYGNWDKLRPDVSLGY